MVVRFEWVFQEAAIVDHGLVLFAVKFLRVHAEIPACSR
jgi:hypothetical protein